MEKSKQSILFITPFYLPHTGGVEIVVRELGKRWVRRHRVIVLAILHDRRLPRKEIQDSIVIYRLGTGINLSLDKYLFPFLAFEKSFFINFDVVYSLMANWAGLAGLFIKSVRPGKRFVLAEHDCNLKKHLQKYFWLSFVVRRIYKKADLLIAVSNYLKKEMEPLVPKGKGISVIYNGIDKHKFYPIWEKRNEFRIIFSGRLVKDKGVDYLLRAIPIVLEKCPQAQFIIVGDGPEENNLKNLAVSLGVADKVNFLGFVSYEKMPSILNSASIFASPAICEEGLPLVFLEAMACGLVRIGTKSGGVKELIKNGDDGLIVRKGDYQQLAEAIIKLLANDSLRKKIIKRTLERIHCFDWDEVAREQEKIIFPTKKKTILMLYLF